MKTRTLLLASLMTALVYVSGQALAAIPNIEAITFLVFVSGFLLGPVAGAVVGACGMGAHSLFNVMGAVPAPILAAQVVAYACVGVAGALLGSVIARTRSRLLAMVIGGVVGTLLVLAYQVMVNIVSYRTFASGMSLRTYLWGGLAFAAVQIAWNAAVFTAAVPPTLRTLARHREELKAR